MMAQTLTLTLTLTQVPKLMADITLDDGVQLDLSALTLQLHLDVERAQTSLEQVGTASSPSLPSYR